MEGRARGGQIRCTREKLSRFLKMGRGVVFRSFSDNNQINLGDFFPKFEI